MKNNGWIRTFFMVFVYWALNICVVSQIYQPNHFMAYLFSVLIFMPLLVWLDLTKPLSKLAVSPKMIKPLNVINFVIILCFMLSTLRIEPIGQILGEFALIPLNLFLTLMALINPVVSNRTRRK